MHDAGYELEGWRQSYAHAWRLVVGWWHGLVLPTGTSPAMFAFEWGVVVLGLMCAAIALAWVWKRVR